MAMETQDIIKRSATNPITPAPRARDYKAEVAKLISHCPVQNKNVIVLVPQLIKGLV